MPKPSGNLRIALALVALLAGAVALHVYVLRVHGVRPQRRQTTSIGKSHRATGQANHGTQSKRILRSLNNR